MTAFRFALLSDVHLGAPRFGEPALAEDAARALEAAVGLCLEAPVDFVLLAGNLFHRPFVAPADLAAAERALARLEGIPVLAIEGDREAPLMPGADSYLRYLAHRGLVRTLVPAFDAATQRYAARAWDPTTGTGSFDEPLPGVRVHGLGVGGGAAEVVLARMLPVLEPGAVTTLGLYYGARRELEADALRRLRTHLDFVACGHPRETGHDGWAYHPGGLVPVRLRDVGTEPPAMLLVEYAQGKYQGERIRVPGREVLRLPDFSVPDCPTPEDFLRELDAALAVQTVPPDAVVALRLVGPVAFPFSELDPTQTSDLVRRRLRAAHPLVSNELNLAGAGTGASPGPVDRRLIEREVLREALLDEVPEHAEHRDQLLDLLEAIRRKPLGDEEGLLEVLALAKAYVERADEAP